MDHSRSSLPTWLNTDPRQEERSEAKVEGILIVRGDEGRPVTITDLSSLGGRIEADFKLSVGSYVALQLPAHVSVCGWVAWSKAGSFGIDFHKSLPAETLAAAVGHAAQVSDRAG